MLCSNAVSLAESMESTSGAAGGLLQTATQLGDTSTMSDDSPCRARLERPADLPPLNLTGLGALESSGEQASGGTEELARLERGLPLPADAPAAVAPGALLSPAGPLDASAAAAGLSAPPPAAFASEPPPPASESPRVRAALQI